MFFERMKELRLYEGYTQQNVADYLKVRRATYAGWETGKDIIPLNRMYDLSNYYQVNLDYLFGVSNKQEKVVPLAKEIDKNVVSENLKNYRKINHITQQDVARVLKTTQSNIHKYETGKCLITTLYALQFSKHYNYSLDLLLGRKDEKVSITQ